MFAWAGQWRNASPDGIVTVRDKRSLERPKIPLEIPAFGASAKCRSVFLNRHQVLLPNHLNREDSSYFELACIPARSSHPLHLSVCRQHGRVRHIEHPSGDIAIEVGEFNVFMRALDPMIGEIVPVRRNTDSVVSPRVMVVSR